VAAELVKQPAPEKETALINTLYVPTVENALVGIDKLLPVPHFDTA
jgi:hypothetical protein